MSCRRNYGTEDVSRSVSEKDMRSKCWKYGIDVEVSHNYLDVNQIFKKVEDIEMLDILKEEMKDVIFPLENPSGFSYDGIVLTRIDDPKTIFNFSHFINSPKLSLNQIS